MLPAAVRTGKRKCRPHHEFFKTSLCEFHTNGRQCPSGSSCSYAHGVEELRTYKTSLCAEWSRHRTCARGDKCTFAHGPGELRRPLFGSGGAKQPSLVVYHGKQETVEKMAHRLDDTLGLVVRVRLRFVLMQEVRRGDGAHAGISAHRAANAVLLASKSLQLDNNFRVNPRTILAFATLFPGFFRVDIPGQRIALTYPTTTTTWMSPDHHDDPLERFLGLLGLSRHLATFRHEGVDFATLLLMRESDLARFDCLPREDAQLVFQMLNC